MTNTRLILLFSVFLGINFSLQAQDEGVRLKGDSAIYNYALQKYIENTGVKDSIIIEHNNAFGSIIRDTLSDVKIISVLSINYVPFVKRKILKEVVVVNPVGCLKNGEFEISVCLFELSYKKKKRTLITPNIGGTRVYMRYDCENNEFVVLRVVELG